MMMRLCGVTDVGRVRRENQDSCAFRRLNGGAAILAVCDGMGGAQAGNVASSVAVETFLSAVEEAWVSGPPADPENVLDQACQQANKRIYDLAGSRPDYDGMGTTLVAALILDDAAHVVNVGDSRCYLLENGSIHQVTVDHSLVQILVDRGEITREEARTHPKKNLITRAVGVDGKVTCDVRRVPLTPGCRLLLCSDGLTNVLTDEILLAESVQTEDPEQYAQHLLSLTLERGAPDNVTVALAQL